MDLSDVIWLTVKEFFAIFLTQTQCLKLSWHPGVEVTVLNLPLHFRLGMVIFYSQLMTVKGIAALVLKRMVLVLLTRECLNPFYLLVCASVGDLLHLHLLQNSLKTEFGNTGGLIHCQTFHPCFHLTSFQRGCQPMLLEFFVFFPFLLCFSLLFFFIFLLLSFLFFVFHIVNLSIIVAPFFSLFFFFAV